MSKTILEHSIKLCIRKKTQVTYDGKSRLKKMKTFETMFELNYSFLIVIKSHLCHLLKSFCYNPFYHEISFFVVYLN